MTPFEKQINDNFTTIHPILGKLLTSQNCIEIDLSSTNSDLITNNVSDNESLHRYIQSKINVKGAIWAKGGYAENRDLYSQHTHFQDIDEARSLHLGVDIWANEDTAIFAPIAGRIHSFQNNKAKGDYGPTIILEHKLPQLTFYTLYGHLSLASIQNLTIGQTIQAGQKIANLGNETINGGWVPHLHFQIILNIGCYVGDYPGVCKKSHANYYLKNCRNPSILIQ